MFLHALHSRFRVPFITLIAGVLPVFLAVPCASAKDPAGEVQVSGPMSVQLTYDEAAIEPQDTDQQTSSTEVDCGGGSLLAAMDCVTEHIESAGSTSTDSGQTRERGTAAEDTEGRPAIHVTMSGTVTPKVTDLGEGRYLLKIESSLSVPQFSPGTPRDVVTRAARDDVALKVGLREWKLQLTAAELQAEPEQVADFSGPFGKLSLFKVQAPQPQTFRVFWRSAQCDELEAEFQQAQTDYIAHVSSMPVLDQIELVTGTLDEIEDALKLTAEGTSKGAEYISEGTELKTVNEKLDELKEETDGLSSALTGALEDIKKRLAEEHEKLMKSSRVGDAALKVQKGLEKNSKMMTEVAETINGLNGNIKKLGELFQVADGKASDQLRAFKDYYGEVQEWLGPLVKAIPGLGVFLDLYGQAIGQIADSAERIEKVVDERNRQARDAGIPEPYIKARTARERAEAEKNRLEKKMNELADRIARECPGFDLSGQKYGEIQAIEDAKHRAHDACEDKRMNLSDEARIRSEFRDASRGYSSRNVTDAEEIYADKLTGYKELQNLYNKVKRNSVRSREDRKQVAKYFELYFKDENRISKYERNETRYLNGSYTQDDVTELESYMKDQQQQLRQAQNKRNEEREKKARYNKAKAANDALNSNNRDYRNCVKNFIQGLAKDKGWNQRLVEVLNSEVFY